MIPSGISIPYVGILHSPFYSLLDLFSLRSLKIVHCYFYIKHGIPTKLSQRYHIPQLTSTVEKLLSTSLQSNSTAHLMFSAPSPSCLNLLLSSESFHKLRLDFCLTQRTHHSLSQRILHSS